MHKIQRVGKWFKWFFMALAFLIPILSALFWINDPMSALKVNTGLVIGSIPKGIMVLHSLSATTRSLGFLVSLIPMSIDLLVLYYLIKLFSLFEVFEIFSHRTVSYIRYIGVTLLVGQLVTPIYQALVSAVLTWHNPLGQRMVVISFSQNNMGILFVAFLIILISWIVSEGQKMQEDQMYTV